MIWKVLSQFWNFDVLHCFYCSSRVLVIFMNVGLKKEKFRQMGIFLEMFMQLNGYSLSNSQAVIGDYAVFTGMDFSNWISCQLINPALIFFPQKDEHSVSLRQLNKFINCLQTKLAYQRSLSKINRTIKKKNLLGCSHC